MVSVTVWANGESTILMKNRYAQVMQLLIKPNRTKQFKITSMTNPSNIMRRVHDDCEQNKDVPAVYV